MKRLFSISLVLALSACFVPWLSGNPLGQRISIPYGQLVLLFTICWLIVLVIGFIKFRLRGLWFLIGLPFILFWPFIGLMVVRAMFHWSD
jgi:hypothetical protein